VSKREEVSWEWRKLYNEELNDLYPSPIIMWMIKRRRIWWAVHVAGLGRVNLRTGFWWGNLSVRISCKIQA